MTHLVLGLGNPGEEYRSTRHNAGFRVVEELARRCRVHLDRLECGALVARVDLPPPADPPAGEAAAPAPAVSAILAKPQTYMNRSGFAARCLAESHALEPARVLVVYDEINLPLGRLRLRRAGSPAGHRGMESIIENLRTEEIARLRVGIAQSDGPPPGGDALVTFVLSPFDRAEEEAFAPVVERAADACETWLRQGIDAAMNRFNAA